MVFDSIRWGICWKMQKKGQYTPKEIKDRYFELRVQLGSHKDAIELLSQELKYGKRTIERYLRITKCIIIIQIMFNNKEISCRAAEDLSFFNNVSQKNIIVFFKKKGIKVPMNFMIQLRRTYEDSMDCELTIENVEEEYRKYQDYIEKCKKSNISCHYQERKGIKHGKTAIIDKTKCAFRKGLYKAVETQIRNWEELCLNGQSVEAAGNIVGFDEKTLLTIAKVYANESGRIAEMCKQYLNENLHQR